MACFYFVIYFTTDIPTYTFLGDCVVFTSGLQQELQRRKDSEESIKFSVKSQ